MGQLALEVRSFVPRHGAGRGAWAILTAALRRFLREGGRGELKLLLSRDEEVPRPLACLLARKAVVAAVPEGGAWAEDDFRTVTQLMAEGLLDSTNRRPSKWREEKGLRVTPYGDIVGLPLFESPSEDWRSWGIPFAEVVEPAEGEGVSPASGTAEESAPVAGAGPDGVEGSAGVTDMLEDHQPAEGDSWETDNVPIDEAPSAAAPGAPP